MNDKTKDPLARWWWPGQWLHIVYGVWIDQLWYWQNVRPWLSGRVRGWEIFFQGSLGSILFSLILLAMLGMLLMLMGIPMNWSIAVLSLILADTFCVLLSVLLAIIRGVTHGVPTCVAGCMTIGIIVGLASSVLSNKESNLIFGVLRSDPNIPSEYRLLVNVSLALAVAIGGLAGGIGWGVANGSKRSNEGVFLAIIIGAIGMGFNTIMGLVMGLTSGLGFYLGEMWTTRQILDAKARKQLANPDEKSPKSE